jgi:hypothetical protein
MNLMYFAGMYYKYNISNWYVANCNTLAGRLYSFRRNFLQSKSNINGYKKLSIGTPKDLESLINTFDRKLKNKEILKGEKKEKYLKKIQEKFLWFYDESFYPRKGKREYYFEYKYELLEEYTHLRHCKLRKKIEQDIKTKTMSMREFVRSGELAKRKKIDRQNEKYEYKKRMCFGWESCPMGWRF